MRRHREVCVDAGVAIKLVVPEPDSHQADALFQEWVAEGVTLIAPAFFEAETDSILRQKTLLRKELTPEQAEAAFRKLQALPLQQLTIPGQRAKAWKFSCDLGFATVYDATYLALAELRCCEFWTADEKLYRRAKDHLPFIRLLGEQ